MPPELPFSPRGRETTSKSAKDGLSRSLEVARGLGICLHSGEALLADYQFVMENNSLLFEL